VPSASLHRPPSSPGPSSFWFMHDKPLVTGKKPAMGRGVYLAARASQPGQHARSSVWCAGAQLGAKSGDVARATVPSGFVPIVGTCQDVGVAGFTLQGGSGWASAYLGPASDNVLSLDAVTVGCARPWRLRSSSCSGI